MPNLFLELFKPFEPNEIEWRVGSTNKDKTSGLALAYVDSRAIMRRLDLVVGPLNWMDTYTVADKSIICNLTLKIGNDWFSKEDGSDQTDIEGTKGGIATALKRAAVKFGIGRYLYDLPPIWVKTEPMTSGNKSTAILKDEGKATASKKLEEFLKGYYKLTPALSQAGKTKLTENLKNAPADFPTLMELFWTEEVNTIAAQNVTKLVSVWDTLTPIQKEVETFKVSYATFSGLPYVYSRFV